jgi:hypothetical protein
MSDHLRKAGTPAGQSLEIQETKQNTVYRSLRAGEIGADRMNPVHEERAAANAQIQRTLKVWRSVKGGEDAEKPKEPEAAKGDDKGADTKGADTKGPDAKGPDAKDDKGAEAKGDTGGPEEKGEKKEGLEVSDPDETAEKEADAKADEIADSDEKDDKEKDGKGGDKKKQQDLGDDKAKAGGEEEKKEEPKEAPAPVAAKLMRKIYLTADPAAKPSAANIPRTYEAYEHHIQTKYAGQLGELATMAEDFKTKGGEAKRQSQQLELSMADIEHSKAEYDAKKHELDEKKQKAMQAKIAAQTAALPNAGANMGQLLERAKELTKQIKEKGNGAKDEKAALEGVMQAAMMLATQIDPEGSGKGRQLYATLDTTENPSLVASARAAGLPEGEVAQMAVNHRNWLRQFFRNKVMTDQTNAEILFLRDQGIVGSREGLTLEQVMQKVIANLQKPNPETKQAALKPDFKLETATEAELNQIYAGVIGSAATTNAGVNSSMGAKT